MDRPFVVFTRDSVVVPGLEVPVPLPVAVGSAPSRSTLVVDPPDLLSIQPDGQIVGHRAGTGTIRSTGGSLLLVTVVAGLRLEPPELRLRPGQSGSFVLVDGSTRVVPPQTALWGTADASVVRVSMGQVEAGTRGTAKVVANIAGAVAEGTVIVEGPAPKIALAPPTSRLMPGAVVAFRAMEGQKAHAAEWTTSNSRVMAKLDGSTFEARAQGRAKVCAVVFDSKVCRDVEVSR